MDQAQFILTQVQQGGYVLSNIQAVGTGLGIIISTFIMWGLMTKNINEKIKSKADKEATDERFKKIEGEINDSKADYKALMAMHQDTNTKVTEIWKFLAEKKK